MSETLNIQQKLLKIQTTLKAPKNQFNAFGKYNYRSCEDILEGLKPILAEVGAIVTLTDEIVQIGERYYVKATATIMDMEGGGIAVSAYAREDIEKKGMDLAQVTGSVSSYSRKYALNGLFCIDDTKDSDSTNQHGKEKDKDKPQPKKETPPPPSWGGSQTPPQPPSSAKGKTISEAQQKRLFAICREHGVPTEEVKAKISAFGFASTKDLDKATYDLVCEWAENYDKDNFTMPEEG